MRSLPFVVVLATLCCTTTALEAALFERDLRTPGDGLLTYDNVNGREWLDLTYTTGVDLATIQADMVSGGLLDGFAFAKFEDVEALALSVGVNWIEPWILPGPEAPEARTLVNFLGIVFVAVGEILPELTFSVGQVASTSSGPEPVFDDTNIYVMNLTTTSLSPLGYPYVEVTYGGIFVSEPISSTFPDAPPLGAGDFGPFWLYRSAVPEPSSAVLLALGSLLIALRKRTSR